MAMRLLKALKRSGFWLRERRNRLWVTPALASVVAVLLALAAALVSRVVPEDTLPDIDRDTVLDELEHSVSEPSHLDAMEEWLDIGMPAWRRDAGIAALFALKQVELCANEQD